MSGEKPVVRISVRAVVETTLHAPDLTPAAGMMQRMREGTAAHKARQEAGGQQIDGYSTEVSLAADYEAETLVLHVTGRADAIYPSERGMVIEEIKLGSLGCALDPAHMAQAAFYGHMLCRRDGLSAVTLRVLYVDTLGARTALYEQEESAQTLEARFDELCAAAARMEGLRLAQRAARDRSFDDLPFPFDTYREGQRKFAVNVYLAIRERKRLFAQAPTGVGKTMAAVYPALRALGEGRTGRVVFLTARTTGRLSAMAAAQRLAERGARLAALEITAKDKTCPREVRDCRPDVCPLAEGFYDRLYGALEEAIRRAAQPGGMLLTRSEVEDMARRYRLCPFELSLQLAYIADLIVCDYNYIFDPAVSLDLLLSAPGGASLLVDEAHQLAPRVQDGYSATISLDELVQLRRAAVKEKLHPDRVPRMLSKASKALKELAKTEEFASGRLKEPPGELMEAMRQVQYAAEDYLIYAGNPVVADIYSMAVNVMMTAQRFDERYAVLTDGGEKHAQVCIYCLNAAPEIFAQTKRARGTVFFSATLAPFDAAKRLLGSAEGDGCLALGTPFSAEQLNVRIAPIDLRYQQREAAAPRVAQEILLQIAAYPGRSIAFFPSYAYMSRVYELMLGMEGTGDIRFLTEQRGMSEDEKSALLSALTSGEENTLLLAVLGGAFAEGIDLPGDALTGVIVVSTGLPRPDGRVRAMQEYYDACGEDGFFLCMTLPGIVRVVQAAGRLIRTDTDRGALLLIDSRYRVPRVRALLDGTLIGESLRRGQR